MRTVYFVLAVTVAAGVQAPSALAGAWVEFLDEDGIKGYSRAVRGSAILEVRSTIVVPARIEVVGAILRDVEGLARPGSSCTEARLIEKRDRNHYTFYLAYDFPWPIANRDVVIRVDNSYAVDKGRVIATLRAVTDQRVPRRQGFVRITDLTAQFVVEYISRNKTGVVYTSRLDPGGHIPAFLVNRGNKQSLRQSAFDLRQATKKAEYQRAAAASPDATLVEKVTRDPRQMERIIASRLGELIGDRALVAALVADPRVFGAMTSGAGKVGEILLHGWGSRESRGLAVRVLLQHLLEGVSRDREAIERFVAQRQLIERILDQRAAYAEVAAFIDRLKQRGR